MSIAYLGLGSNVGDRAAILSRTRIYINIYLGAILRTSQLYISAPWGYKDQASFINQVVEIGTELDPVDLHGQLLYIEELLGKQKSSKYGPRNIDIDILLYDNLKVNTKSLDIPHPRMLERNFVLIPLAEIAPMYIHPVSGLTIGELSIACPDTCDVAPYPVDA